MIRTIRGYEEKFNCAYLHPSEHCNNILVSRAENGSSIIMPIGPYNVVTAHYHPVKTRIRLIRGNTKGMQIFSNTDVFKFLQTINNRNTVDPSMHKNEIKDFVQIVVTETEVYVIQFTGSQQELDEFLSCDIEGDDNKLDRYRRLSLPCEVLVLIGSSYN